MWAAFVFGFDEDTQDVFETTVEFATQGGVIMASFAVLTPYPGTRLYARLKQEGRLFDERWWLHERRDGFPFFRPKQMSPSSCSKGGRVRGNGSTADRRSCVGDASSAGSSSSLAAFLPLNLYQRRLTYEKIIGGNRFFMRDRREKHADHPKTQQV